MDLPSNAFIGKETRPTSKELAAKLNASLRVWKELTNWLSVNGLTCGEWHSVSPKYGWSLLAVLKKRRIVYLSPCEGCFRTSFVLGDKAIAAARESDLPDVILKQIAASRRYAEGTGVQLLVRHPADLPAIRKLVEIKLQN
jgi:hypothetical protein